jgi:hypothetical protein
MVYWKTYSVIRLKKVVISFTHTSKFKHANEVHDTVLMIPDAGEVKILLFEILGQGIRRISLLHVGRVVYNPVERSKPIQREKRGHNYNS